MIYKREVLRWGPAFHVLPVKAAFISCLFAASAYPVVANGPSNRYSPTRPGARVPPVSALVSAVREAAPEISLRSPEIVSSPAPVSEPSGSSVESWLDAQIELARRGFSSGSIDGAAGPKTRAALSAFQASRHLPATGELDATTRPFLVLSAPPLAQHTLSVAERGELQPLRPTWLGKSQQSALAYETVLEAVAERFHAHPALIRRLNPTLNWDSVSDATSFVVTAVERVVLGVKAARLRILLSECVLEACDEKGSVLAHFPVSIGREAVSRPLGELRVTMLIPDPVYTFDPDIFPESAEARELGRKLILPAGPNNPVGVAWIGLDRPGYGIHGTPSPERIGRAESHGCFRLANWDARTLLDLAWPGLPVGVEP